jgi:ATP-dependent Lon protease
MITNRDAKSVQKLASGYLKLLFPDLTQVIPVQFQEYCLEPAIGLRKNIRMQMSLMDAEYSPVMSEIRAK